MTDTITIQTRRESNEKVNNESFYLYVNGEKSNKY